MIETLGLLTDPERTLREISDSTVLSFSFVHNRDYCNQQPVTLNVVFEPTTTRCVITTTDLQAALVDCANLDGVCELLGLNPVRLNQPNELVPVSIDKPWGREVWFTGMEERGVSMLSGIPLPWLLQCFPQRLLGSRYEPPVLLKVLEPSAETDLGNLYFEAHEFKQEVYVVTDVDERAWPDGVGKIRFGFNQQKRAVHRNDEAFRQAYLAVTQRYEQIMRVADGLLPDQDADPVTGRAAVGALPAKLADQLTEIRLEHDAFTQIYPLRIGDVVRVPPFTPHSLQHGVTVVEFQSPHYERLILSFGQKVLTQETWDTRDAMTKVSLDSMDPVYRGGDNLIAEFDAFRAQRRTIVPGESMTLQSNRYALLKLVSGELSSSDALYPSGTAMFLPANTPFEFENSGQEDALILLAAPNDSS